MIGHDASLSMLANQKYLLHTVLYIKYYILGTFYYINWLSILDTSGFWDKKTELMEVGSLVCPRYSFEHECSDASFNTSDVVQGFALL